MSAVETKMRNVGFDWEEIDIFLFSNGQKCSPPRKYHLSTDELDWWEATLNYLAKSHYGSSQTAVELYTLRGNKIGGPRELFDGMPCVAVVPPDTFTDSGYEQYLMKASRSFEKRKAKNTNSNDQSEVKTSDAMLIDIDKQNQKPCLVNVGDLTATGPEENTDVSNVMVRAQKNMMQKSKLPDSHTPRSNISPSSNHRNERRRSTAARTSFLNTPVQLKKNSKQDSQMKTLRSSFKANEPDSMISDKSKGVSNNLKQNEMLKSLLPKPPPNITTALTAKSSIPATPLNCHTMISVNSREFLKEDPVPLMDLINNKEIFVIAEDANLYENPLPEDKSMKLDEYVRYVVDEITDCNITQTTVNKEIQTKVELSSCEVSTATDKNVSPSNSKIKVIPATIASQSNIMNCDIPLGNNCIAVINKGDAVNLKLQIELPNVSTHTNIRSNSNMKSARKASSLSNLFKKRKSDHSGEQAVEPTQSLESVICGINDCYTKVVVVQCSCCGNKTTIPRVDTLPVYKDPNGFFILMPTAAHECNNCLCCPNHKRLCPDTTAMSALCVEDLCKPKSSTIYPCVQEVGMVMTLTGSFGSQTKERQKNGIENSIDTKRTWENNIMSIKNDRYTVDEYDTSPSGIAQKLEYIISTGNTPKALSSERMDSYTQTEWCTTLLEAQRHEDGRYTFHFPSLLVLKHYSLI